MGFPPKKESNGSYREQERENGLNFSKAAEMTLPGGLICSRTGLGEFLDLPKEN